MRSTVPRMRTVSCADAGRANETRAKLEATSTHRNFSAMTDSGGCMMFWQHRRFGNIPAANAITPRPIWRPRCYRRNVRLSRQAPGLLGLDAGVLDDPAPALLFLAEIAVERGRRACHQHEAL